MSLRWYKTSSDEATLMKRTRVQYYKTVQARRLMKTLLAVEPITIDQYREKGRELVLQ